MPPSVRYTPTSPALLFQDGTRVTLDDDRRGVLDVRLLNTVSVDELTEAVAAWSADDVFAHTWQIWPAVASVTTRAREPYPDVIFAYDFDSRELRAVVYLDIEPEEDPAFEASLPALLAPIANRWSAEALLEDDPIQGQWLTVQMVLEDSERPAGDLLAVALDVAALLKAARDGQLTLTSVRDLLAGGRAGALVGAREGGWLDAKGAPYQLHDERQAWELAKDVAAFASSGGGIILIPATTRADRTGEVIEHIGSLPRELVDEQRYCDVVAARVFPQPRGLEVRVVCDDAERGQLYIYVPPQREEHKPFLVRGAPVQGRILAQSITLPWRDGEVSRYDDIGAVHAALRVDRVRERDDVKLLEQLRLDGVSPVFVQVLEAARAVGLSADVVPGGFRIWLPDELPLDLNTRDLHPKMEALALHTALERLEPHGVQSHPDDRGFRVLGTLPPGMRPA